MNTLLKSHMAVLDATQKANELHDLVISLMQDAGEAESAGASIEVFQRLQAISVVLGELSARLIAAEMALPNFPPSAATH